jgi:hypothetical protein
VGSQFSGSKWRSTTFWDAPHEPPEASTGSHLLNRPGDHSRPQQIAGFAAFLDRTHEIGGMDNVAGLHNRWGREELHETVEETFLNWGLPPADIELLSCPVLDRHEDGDAPAPRMQIMSFFLSWNLGRSGESGSTAAPAVGIWTAALERRLHRKRIERVIDLTMTQQCLSTIQ